MDGDLAKLLAIVAAASVAYGKILGPYQMQLSEWVIAAGRVPSRWRGLVNLGVGVALATAVAAVASWQAGDWAVLAVGFLGGILASVEAAKVHDAKDAP